MEFCNTQPICAIAIFHGNPYESYFLWDFERDIQDDFIGTINKILNGKDINTQENCALQFGYLDLYKNPKLSEFMWSKFGDNLKPGKAQYLLINPENGKFELKNYQGFHELQNSAFKKFNESNNQNVDYLVNYNIDFEDLLEISNEGFLKVFFLYL